MDKKYYNENLERFKANILNKTTSEIFLFLDEEPQFKISKVPFSFKYCSKILIKAENILYEIPTSQNEIGIDTFWIQETNIQNLSNYYQKFIGSKIKDLNYKYSIENYAFKIEFEFCDNFLITLFAAEIYENYKSIDYKLNDEMILYFDNRNDILIFEKLIKNNASR